METRRINIMSVTRGSLAPGPDGRAVVLDTLSGENGVPFWHDRSGGKHHPDADGTITVFTLPDVQLHAHGETRGTRGASHALSSDGRPICPNGRRSQTLTVWESRTALAGVTCKACRETLNLAPLAPRRRNGT